MTGTQLNNCEQLKEQFTQTMKTLQPSVIYWFTSVKHKRWPLNIIEANEEGQNEEGGLSSSKMIINQFLTRRF